MPADFCQSYSSTEGAPEISLDNSRDTSNVYRGGAASMAPDYLGYDTYVKASPTGMNTIIVSLPALQRMENRRKDAEREREREKEREKERERRGGAERKSQER